MIPLSKRRLEAIREALMARLAGEFDIEGVRREDYIAALDWADEKIRDRKRRSSVPPAK
jgi:hypothetical protein